MLRYVNSMFIAIGVGQGDAFFFQRRDRTALIDGGRSRLGFAEQFQRTTKRNAVDILVCTHNDADHALGVLGFLQNGLRSKEVWLPGSWTDRLADLLLNESEFFEELVENIGTADASGELPPPILEILGDRLSKSESRQQGEVEPEASLDAMREAFENAEAAPDLLWPYSLLWPPRYLWFASHLWDKAYGKGRLLLEAVSAASRIKEISLAAYHSGSRIRWFEYHQSANSGGMEGFLLPLNAREIVPPQKRWSALQYLALTTANTESLVFQAPSNAREAPVLFTADSDLSFSQRIVWSDGMIITAPHHGSESNSFAYRRFGDETTSSIHAIWVRSDGRYSNRPGSSYLGVRGDRFCTLCRESQTPKQDVRLSVVSARWKPQSTTPCSCPRAKKVSA